MKFLDLPQENRERKLTKKLMAVLDTLVYISLISKEAYISKDIYHILTIVKMCGAYTYACIFN